MTNERWHAVNEDIKARLTPEEIAQGWHFCVEFDGLLVGPGSQERQFCGHLCPLVPESEKPAEPPGPVADQQPDLW